jgi:hypothetical protein
MIENGNIRSVQPGLRANNQQIEAGCNCIQADSSLNHWHLFNEDSWDLSHIL